MEHNLNISDTPIFNRTVFENDNLKVLRIIKDECIDLIYLDPPFNSKTDYILDGKGFLDTWGEWKDSEQSKYLWFELFKTNEKLHNFICLSEMLHSPGMKYYLIYLTVRLIEMHRVLKPSGRIALHCDDNASHYLKICLDCIFGCENFRNDIAILYRNGSKNAKNHFPRNKDNILFYSKDIKQTKFFNTKGRPSEKTLRNIEKGWKITWNSRSGKWHETYYRPYETFTPEEVNKLDIERIRKLKKRPAEIHIRQATNGEEIKYLDWWDNISIIPQSHKRINDPNSESVGWPTQKSILTPGRIIECCTEKGDIIFDPFCGSGTTLLAAEGSKRKWLGCDISKDAVEISIKRLERFMGVFNEPIYKI